MTTRVRDLMSTVLLTVGPNDKLASAADLMKLGRVRHMPVVDEDGDLVGIVTQRDLFHSGLLKAMGYGTHGTEKLLSMLLIKEAMTVSPITIGPDEPIEKAAEVMLDKKIGCLPVSDGEGGLLGILTEADFVRLHAPA